MKNNIEDWERELPYQVRLRKDSPNYFLRFSVKGFNQLRFGLGTSNKMEAHKLAREIYYQTLADAKAGTLGGKKAFKHFANEYVDALHSAAIHNPQKLQAAKHADSIVGRYFIPKLGDVSINVLSPKHVHEYLEWRQCYWISGRGKDINHIVYERGGKKIIRNAKKIVPSPATLKREAHVLRSIFKLAVYQGVIKLSDIPLLPMKQGIPNRRPYFSKNNMAKLVKLAQQRTFGETTNKRVHYERKVLLSFILISVATGMRPGEIFGLKWGSIEGLEEILDGSATDKSFLKITAQGKGKGPQQLIPKKSVQSSFINLMDLFYALHGRAPEAKDPVFCNFNGKPLKSLNNGLNRLLVAANLKTNANGQNYSAYSFRHTYATWALQKKPPVDIYTLSINMRTSVRMIEKYYGHIQSEDHADILSENDDWR